MKTLKRAQAELGEALSEMKVPFVAMVVVTVAAFVWVVFG